MTVFEGERVTPALVLPAGAFGGDTAVTLTVTSPLAVAGAPIPCTATDAGQTHTATLPVTLDSPGVWAYRWDITGTGECTRYDTLSVSPPASTPPGPGRVYATTADYARWLSAAPPAGAFRALWVASRRVDALLATALYDTDADGYPLDVDQRRAVRLACCAQADYQRAIGDPYGRGALGTLSSVSIGSVSVGRATTASGSSAPPRYSEDAVQFLADAGLLNHGPITGW